MRQTTTMPHSDWAAHGVWQHAGSDFFFLFSSLLSHHDEVRSITPAVELLEAEDVRDAVGETCGYACRLKVMDLQLFLEDPALAERSGTKWSGMAIEIAAQLRVRR